MCPQCLRWAAGNTGLPTVDGAPFWNITSSLCSSQKHVSPKAAMPGNLLSPATLSVAASLDPQPQLQLLRA